MGRGYAILSDGLNASFEGTASGLVSLDITYIIMVDPKLGGDFSDGITSDPPNSSYKYACM